MTQSSTDPPPTPRQPLALDNNEYEDDGRLFSPSAARNRDIIAAAVTPHAQGHIRALEIASGTGEHVTHIASRTPWVDWTPSDPDARARQSIAAWTTHMGLSNVAAPISIDTTAKTWPVTAGFALVLSINMVHIAPWAAAEGLLAGAARVLTQDGKLMMYGPFHVDGAATAPSNARFDADLRAKNPLWGVRDTAQLSETAKSFGLVLTAQTPMPANNQILCFERKTEA